MALGIRTAKGSPPGTSGRFINHTLTYVRLPFLTQKDQWPVMRDEPEERVVNPSHDTQLQDHLVDEIMMAMEKKDSSSLRDALMALIQNIKNEDNDEM